MYVSVHHEEGYTCDRCNTDGGDIFHFDGLEPHSWLCGTCLAYQIGTGVLVLANEANAGAECDSCGRDIDVGEKTVCESCTTCSDCGYSPSSYCEGCYNGQYDAGSENASTYCGECGEGEVSTYCRSCASSAVSNGEIEVECESCSTNIERFLCDEHRAIEFPATAPAMAIAAEPIDVQWD